MWNGYSFSSFAFSLSGSLFSFARMNGVWLFWVRNVVLFVRMLIKLAMANYYYRIIVERLRCSISLACRLY